MFLFSSAFPSQLRISLRCLKPLEESEGGGSLRLNPLPFLHSPSKPCSPIPHFLTGLDAHDFSTRFACTVPLKHLHAT